MPFALNESTRFISPTKTPEFLAAGRPVVSTPIHDVVDPYGLNGLVGIAADAASFAQALETEMVRDREVFLADVDRFLAGKSWDRTWQEMLARLADARRGRTPSAAGAGAGALEREAGNV
jgi:UDP-galactopyranose mutase